jgi:hypothetical protein
VHDATVGIEPFGLIQIRKRAVKVAAANETGGSDGMGETVAGIEPDCFIQIRKRLIEFRSDDDHVHGALEVGL